MRTDQVLDAPTVSGGASDAAADKRRAQAEARAARAAARAALRAQQPQRDPEFSHLSLTALRTYRQSLADEENRVSYWRRILQARLDTMQAGARITRADVEHLKPVLSEQRVTAGRTALITILPVDDIPPLPNLAELWDSDPDPDDTQARALLEEELIRAEEALSDYRAALHRRIGSATAELIARYHEQPGLCLDALPLQPDRAGTRVS